MEQLFSAGGEKFVSFAKSENFVDGKIPRMPFFTFRHLLAHHVHFRRADFFPVACCHVCTFHSSTTVADYQAQTRYRL